MLRASAAAEVEGAVDAGHSAGRERVDSEDSEALMQTQASSQSLLPPYVSAGRACPWLESSCGHGGAPASDLRLRESRRAELNEEQVFVDLRLLVLLLEDCFSEAPGALRGPGPARLGVPDRHGGRGRHRRPSAQEDKRASSFCQSRGFIVRDV